MQVLEIHQVQTLNLFKQAHKHTSEIWINMQYNTHTFRIALMKIKYCNLSTQLRNTCITDLGISYL